MIAMRDLLVLAMVETPDARSHRGDRPVFPAHALRASTRTRKEPERELRERLGEGAARVRTPCLSGSAAAARLMLPSQYRLLVPQHQQFDVLGEFGLPTPSQQRQNSRERSVGKESNIGRCSQT